MIRFLSAFIPGRHGTGLLRSHSDSKAGEAHLEDLMLKAPPLASRSLPMQKKERGGGNCFPQWSL